MADGRWQAVEISLQTSPCSVLVLAIATALSQSTHMNAHHFKQCMGSFEMARLTDLHMALTTLDQAPAVQVAHINASP